MLAIDTHQHLFPSGYSDMLDKNLKMTGGLAGTPAWNPELAIETMDRFGIGTGILSNPVPSFGSESDARYWARSVNEVGASLVAAQPDRFGYFAMIPVPYVDAAIEEVDYAYDTLHVDGVILLANNDGTYLGDPTLEPLLRELNARKAVVFVHPNNLPGPVVPGIPSFAADFLLDTTRAAIQLVMSGAMDRFTDLRIILAHAGGFLPYMAYRILPMLSQGKPEKMDEVLASLKRFYFDIALSASPSALPSLLAFADPTHITFGSDWPAAPTDAVEFFGTQFDSYPMAESTRAAITRGNAELLFPRLTSGA